MGKNLTLLHESVSAITKTSFKKAVFLCYQDGITSTAPLGWSGDTIILYETVREGTHRCSQVSVRNYCGDAELLITDQRGAFLFYGRFDMNIGIDFVTQQYWEVFKKVKSLIETEVPNVSEFKNVRMKPNVDPLEGYSILRAFQKSHK